MILPKTKDLKNLVHCVDRLVHNVETRAGSLGKTMWYRESLQSAYINKEEESFDAETALEGIMLPLRLD